MKNIKSCIKSALSFYYTDSVDFSDPLSSGNIVLESALENLNDMIVYYNCDLLVDFNDGLKPANYSKLKSWLNDQDILFLFEHDLIISRGCEYYQSSDEFLTYYVSEHEFQLSDGLTFENLTSDQISDLESELDVCIPENSKNTFYGLGTGFSFKLPKKAILKAYKEANQ